MKNFYSLIALTAIGISPISPTSAALVPTITEYQTATATIFQRCQTTVTSIITKSTRLTSTKEITKTDTKTLTTTVSTCPKPTTSIDTFIDFRQPMTKAVK